MTYRHSLKIKDANFILNEVDIEALLNKMRSHVGMVIHSTTLDTMDKVIDVYGGSEWVKIEGRFLLGTSSSHSVNSTGGAETHTLTANQMPSHTHTFTGTAASHNHTFTGTAAGHTHTAGNHRHSIPALSGTAASAGAHTHSGNTAVGWTSFMRITAGAAINGMSNHIPGPANGGYADVSNTSDFPGGNHVHGFDTNSAGAHTHSVSTTASNTGYSNPTTSSTSITPAGTIANKSVTPAGTNSSTGGQAFDKMPPYKTVYILERTA